MQSNTLSNLSTTKGSSYLSSPLEGHVSFPIEQQNHKTEDGCTASKNENVFRDKPCEKHTHEKASLEHHLDSKVECTNEQETVSAFWQDTESTRDLTALVLDTTPKRHLPDLSPKKKTTEGQCQNNKDTASNIIPAVETENVNGCEHENNIHPYKLLCLSKSGIEGPTNSHVVSVKYNNGIDGKIMNALVCHSYSLSLQTSTHDTSRTTTQAYNNISLCDVKQSSCFNKEVACNVNACQGYKQLIEGFSPMQSEGSKLETKIEYDIMTDEIITCSVYEVWRRHF